MINYCAVLLGVSCYLMWPFSQETNSHKETVQDWQQFIRRLRRLISSEPARDQEVQSLILLCSAYLNAGVHFEIALGQALQAMPEEFLPNTRLAIRHHISLGPALAKDVLENGLDELQLLIVGAEVSDQTGMPLEPMLLAMQRNSSFRSSLKQVMQQELASTKATVMLLSCLPIAGIALSFLLGSNSIHWLFTSNVGRICAVLGLVFEIAGMLWVHTMVSRVTQS